jgi:hypothetical protein
MEKLKAFAFKQQVIDMGKDLLAESSKLYGPGVIFRRLWERLGLGKMLQEALQGRKVEAQFHEAIFCMVLNRLLDAGSKRGTFFWKDTVYVPEWENLQLPYLYRVMDFLEHQAEALEAHLSQRFLNLFNWYLDLVLMDTTTVMYDGEGEDSAFLDYGYSRDKRSDLKQIVVGVLMTKEGIPLGCEVFPGNLSDRRAFPVLWERVRKRFPGIGRLVVVCDRGPVSKKNLAHLEALGLDYIVGVRMRSLGEKERLRL